MADTQYCYRHPDRETGLSCSECGRPICVDCMCTAPVGIRCPDHAATGRPLSQTVKAARPSLSSGTLVTKALIAFNVAFYLVTVAQGVGVNQPGGRLFGEFALFGPLVADGDWWRLITAAFLHASLLHIAFNMLALWWVGGPARGRRWARGASSRSTSCRALPARPARCWPARSAVTVGASGAIFGLFGAMVVIQWQSTGSLAGPAMTLILVNLAITFAIPASHGEATSEASSAASSRRSP